jgi:hypothetical protein
MKLRAVVEFILPENEFSKPGDARHLEADQRVVEELLPRGSIIKSVEHVPDQNDLRTAFKKLLRLKLEGIPPGFTRREGYSKGDELAPFFSEAMLYPLLGKEDARTVLAYIHNLMKVGGIDPYELEREVNTELNVEEAAEAKRVVIAQRRREFRMKFLKQKGWEDHLLTDTQRAEMAKARKEAGIP